MKIGIMVLSVGNFGNKGFYNLQEIGLARTLAKYCKKVSVYKLVATSESQRTEQIDDATNAFITYLPSRSIGTNGIPNMKYVDSDIDVLICFSDTQLMVKRVYDWAKRNDVIFLPYIGVVESHSSNIIRTHIKNILSPINRSVYQKSLCLAKTPEIMHSLKEQGVKRIEVCPVGLDLNIVKTDADNFAVHKLKSKYGYKENEKIVLFIGRMDEEKQPLKMIEIFDELQEFDSDFRLLMVGRGKLRKQIEVEIKRRNIGSKVQLVERIPNKDIWELYKMSYCFVNLNDHEIYGMVLLEAMYYGCTVIAWSAPGPNFIIEDKVTGYLVRSNKEAVISIINKKDLTANMKKRVIDKFTWESSAKMIVEMANKEGKSNEKSRI